MNIHLDVKHLNYLQELAIYQCPIGSQLYGTATKSSDTDVLYLYPESWEELQNPFFNHHQFQIKTEGIDHIFSSIRQFVRNLMQGDSSINVDVLMLTNICDEIPVFQELKAEMQYCYPVLKCFLGMAKRDLKAAQAVKKLRHAQRGLACYEWLRLKGNYKQTDFLALSDEEVEFEMLKAKEKELRKQVNDDYDQDIVKKHLSVTCQKAIIHYLETLERAEKNHLLTKQLATNNSKAFYY